MSQEKSKDMRKVALTSLSGTSIEWYDFFLYGTGRDLSKGIFSARSTDNGGVNRILQHLCGWFFGETLGRGHLRPFWRPGWP